MQFQNQPTRRSLNANVTGSGASFQRPPLQQSNVSTIVHLQGLPGLQHLPYRRPEIYSDQSSNIRESRSYVPNSSQPSVQSVTANPNQASNASFQYPPAPSSTVATNYEVFMATPKTPPPPVSPTSPSQSPGATPQVPPQPTSPGAAANPKPPSVASTDGYKYYEYWYEDGK